MSQILLILATISLAWPAFAASLTPLQDVRLKNTAGTELATPAAPLRVDPTGTTNQPVTQATSPWVTSRTWTLSSGTDSCLVNQGTSPWVVSGTVTANQGGTWNLNNISGTVSLPTGASTSSLQTTGNSSLSSIVTNTNALNLSQGSTTSGQTGSIALGAATTAAPSYSTGTSNPLSLTTVGALRTDSSATTQPVSAVSLPLPTGAATSALQTTGNSSLSSIDTKTPALVSGRVPVDGSGVTQPVSGTVTANQGTSPWVTSRNWTLSSGTDSIAAVQSGTWTVQPGNTANTTPWLVSSIPLDGTKATYSTSFNAIATAATPSDVFTITGSGTKTVRVTRVEFTATQTTGSTTSILLLRRSTADSGGTSTSGIAVSHDSTNAAATATVKAYTANPTVGTLVGSVRALRTLIPALSAGSAESQPIFWDFNRPSQAIVLRGTSEVLAFNLNAVTLIGGSFDFDVEWTEE